MKFESVEFLLEGEVAMVTLGRALGGVCGESAVIFLQGDLGAGKTTFTRGFLSGKGFIGAVKSPTFTLVEDYVVANQRIYHFDLYRLTSAEELEFMGIRDFFHTGSICLVEWPERGVGYLPEPDLRISFLYESAGARRLQLHAGTAEGRRMLASLKDKDSPGSHSA